MQPSLDGTMLHTSNYHNSRKAHQHKDITSGIKFQHGQSWFSENTYCFFLLYAHGAPDLFYNLRCTRIFITNSDRTPKYDTNITGLNTFITLYELVTSIMSLQNELS